jgi:hypothetical protein
MASQNRAAGSGGGSGQHPLRLVGSGSNFSAAYASTSTSDVVIPGVTTTFQVSIPSYHMVLVSVTGKVSGAAGTFGYGSLYIDTVLQSHTNGRLVALFDKGIGGYTSNTLSQLIMFQPGIHTIELDLHVDNAALTYNHYHALLEVFSNS